MTQKRALIVILSTIYLMALSYLLFFAFFREATNTHVNMRPFASIWPLTKYTFTSGHGILHWIINVPGNIAAFFPMPFLVFYFVPKKSLRIFLLALVFSAPFLVEFIQYFFQNGSCDVDDVILNEIGILTAYAVLRRQKNSTKLTGITA